MLTMATVGTAIKWNVVSLELSQFKVCGDFFRGSVKSNRR